MTAAGTAPERAARPDRPSMTQVAGRLINGSVRRSYEPAVAIDWEAPLVDGAYYLPQEIVSLYGTAYWEELTEDQRIELSRQELANVLSVGLWFENILNRGLLLQLLREDPAAPFAHYVLTEMGDECRHMTMFGKVIDRVGARPFRMRPVDRFMAAALPPAVSEPDFAAAEASISPRSCTSRAWMSRLLSSSASFAAR